MDFQSVMFFVKKHMLLTLGFVVILITTILNEIRERKLGAKSLTPQELVLMINDEQPIIIDLRDADSYKKSHILGSKNINNKEPSPTDLEKYKKNSLVIVCEQGLTSEKFANKLKGLGWNNVFILAGGINSWRADGLPFEKK